MLRFIELNAASPIVSQGVHGGGVIGSGIPASDLTRSGGAALTVADDDWALTAYPIEHLDHAPRGASGVPPLSTSTFTLATVPMLLALAGVVAHDVAVLITEPSQLPRVYDLRAFELATALAVSVRKSALMPLRVLDDGLRRRCRWAKMPPRSPGVPVPRCPAGAHDHGRGNMGGLARALRRTSVGGRLGGCGPQRRPMSPPDLRLSDPRLRGTVCQAHAPRPRTPPLIHRKGLHMPHRSLPVGIAPHLRALNISARWPADVDLRASRGAQTAGHRGQALQAARRRMNGSTLTARSGGQSRLRWLRCQR